jgi:hypothetical protein
MVIEVVGAEEHAVTALARGAASERAKTVLVLKLRSDRRTE